MQQFFVSSAGYLGMTQTEAPGVKVRIDLVRNGHVTTRYLGVIRAEGDLFRVIKKAFERLRKEHPNRSASDVSVSISYDN